MLIFGIRILIACLVLCGQLGGSSSAQQYAQTVETIRTARSEEMRRYLNESVDPCENFYEYACGNWKTYHVALGNDVTSPFYNTQQDVNRKIAELLMIYDKTCTASERKVKVFFESCMNLVSDSKKLKNELEKIAGEFGEMPAIYENLFDEDSFDWERTVAEIAFKYDIRILLNYHVFPDPANKSHNIMLLEAPDFFLELPALYLEDEYEIYRSKYRQIIEKNLKTYLGLSENVAKTTAREIVDFEASLNNITMAAGFSDSDTLANATTIEALQRKYMPDLNIGSFINTSFGFIPTPELREVNESYNLNLVRVMRATPKRIVANYVFYGLLKQFMPEISRVKSQLQQLCVENTQMYFTKLLENMIYRKYHTHEMNEGLQHMWQNIKSTFQIFLESGQMDWMSRATRQGAVEKIKAMQMYIRSYENYDFEADYGQTSFSGDNYAANVRSVLKLRSAKARASFYEPYTSEDNSFSPLNSLLENAVRVPVLYILPYYFYSNLYPSAVNFGRLGFVLAHEVIHGFDDNGAERDKDGNEFDWWDLPSAQNFANRIVCFFRQHQELVYRGRQLPPLESQTENIADSGGLHLAYEAYRRTHEKALRTIGQVDLESLPDFYYNSNRMFFISFAQTWCTDAQSSSLEFMAATDNHSPPEIRVRWSLSNLPEFAEEFNCPSGSPMNPVHKCTIY